MLCANWCQRSGQHGNESERKPGSLIHVEVQGETERAFAEAHVRLSLSRLFDQNYRVDVISLDYTAPTPQKAFRQRNAVHIGLVGRLCGSCFVFATVANCLIGWANGWAELEVSDNRFALVDHGPIGSQGWHRWPKSARADQIQVWCA